MALPINPPTAPTLRCATGPSLGQTGAVLLAHLVLLLLLWGGQPRPTPPTPAAATAWVQARVLTPAAPAGAGAAPLGQAEPPGPAAEPAPGGDASPVSLRHRPLLPPPQSQSQSQSPPQQQRLSTSAERQPGAAAPAPLVAAALPAAQHRPAPVAPTPSTASPGPSPERGPASGHAGRLLPARAQVLPDPEGAEGPDDPSGGPPNRRAEGLAHGLADGLPALGSAADPRAAHPAHPLSAAQSAAQSAAHTALATTAQTLAPSADQAIDQAIDPAELGTPPPLYPVRWPAARRVAYLGLQGGRPVQAELDWQPNTPDSGPYRLALSLWPGGAAPLVAAQPQAVPPPPAARLQQHSQGQLSPHGLVPERLLDRRRGRGARAVNLQWPEPGTGEAGRLSFSASTARWPAWPGTQDRLSWLLQLAAVADAAAQSAATPPMPAAPAAPAQPLSQVELLVADASGGIGRWRLVLQGEVTPPWPGGPRRLQHWRHSPDAADGLQVDVWLDPAQGHWPAGWRYTLLRTGAQLLLWQASPGAP